MANECIPLYRPGADVTAVATAAVNGKRFVDLSAGSLNAATGALASVAHATAAGKAVGVAAFDAPSGASVAIIRGKGTIVPVAAAGTIAYGTEVEVGAAGKVVALASGKAVGRAWQAGSNNNDVLVELY